MICFIGQLKNHEKVIAERELETTYVCAVKSKSIYIRVMFVKMMTFNEREIAKEECSEEANEDITRDERRM